MECDHRGTPPRVSCCRVSTLATWSRIAVALLRSSAELVSMPRALEQRLAKLLFKRLDLPAQRGLRDAERLGPCVMSLTVSPSYTSPR